MLYRLSLWRVDLCYIKVIDKHNPRQTKEMGCISFVYLPASLFALGVMVAADQIQQEYVSKSYRTLDPSEDPHFSKVIAAKAGYKFFTNVAEKGLTETLKFTHDDGLYVAWEKVVTANEHRVLLDQVQMNTVGVDNVNAGIQELRSDLRSLFREEMLSATLCQVPPQCIPPGGKYLRHNGSSWLCVCEEGWSGGWCEFSPTLGPTVAETSVPTNSPATSSPETLGPTVMETSVPTVSSPTTRVPLYEMETDEHSFGHTVLESDRGAALLGVPVYALAITLDMFCFDGVTHGNFVASWSPFMAV
ncbi:hypothetical protein CYMTET_56456 [Cymbomonas tetramitiformis]|uniref:EGF-like domain-containing protein n=1 Tax=Cymbomonas tetramitiformis TaxID=36881 RepID=A0AAE0BCD1_9CHLO|nr:hypothetical protein CYMTET_56456 [Cymbomonas tetramitiformis]